MANPGSQLSLGLKSDRVHVEHRDSTGLIGTKKLYRRSTDGSMKLFTPEEEAELMNARGEMEWEEFEEGEEYEVRRSAAPVSPTTTHTQIKQNTNK